MKFEKLLLDGYINHYIIEVYLLDQLHYIFILLYYILFYFIPKVPWGTSGPLARIIFSS